MTLSAWAVRHAIPPAALAELRAILTGVPDSTPTEPQDGSEAALQNLIRLEASRVGGRLWRNNLGAGRLDNGSYVRWGIANDSARLNAQIKSSDLIGIRPVLITQGHVGHTLGVFLAREIKAPGWKYRATEREQAQLRFIELIVGLGGDAAFASSEGSIV
jgi:hypothetical protein